MRIGDLITVNQDNPASGGSWILGEVRFLFHIYDEEDAHWPGYYLFMSEGGNRSWADPAFVKNHLRML